jgi:hypothetical protein
MFFNKKSAAHFGVLDLSIYKFEKKFLAREFLNQERQVT